MFGYIKPHVPELKVGQYELYRGIYCGLCRSMGRVSGQLSRMTLSYDFVFLAAVRMILCGVDPLYSESRCMAHPMKKRAVLEDNEALRYTAAVSALLAGEKNADDLSDERGVKRIKALLLSPLLASMSKRAQRKLEEHTDEKIRDLLGELSLLEKGGCSSADQAADAFGRVLATVFSLGLDGEKEALAQRIGHSTGRFVYLCDAADDMVQDIRQKRYNPLALGWGDLALDESTGEMSAMVKESVRTSAPIDLEALGEAVEELDESHPLTPIVKNIVYLGMTAAMERILNKQGPKACATKAETI